MLTRRQMMTFMARAGGSVAAASLLTGIPAAILANPRKALAAWGNDKAIVSPQFLILSITNQGDPLNCHVPGTYADTTIFHPDSANFAATPITLGNTPVTGAKTWTQLPAATLAQTCFFHGATYSGIHTDAGKIQALSGATSNSDMLVSNISRLMQPSLSTIQAAPMVLTPQQVTSSGQPVSSVPPPSLKTLYQLSSLGPSGLSTLRDTALIQINTWIKSNGTAAQGAYVDNFVRSQQEAREVPDALLGALTSLNDTTPQSQVAAAITLFQMRITAAAVIYIPFGADNHADPGLQNEMAAYDGNAPRSVTGVPVAGKTGVAAMADMVSQIETAGMTDQVTFASLGVFGRTLGPSWQQGRTHNNFHHVGVLIGSKVKGSVVGGLKTGTASGYALGIDSSTGVGTSSGDIPFDETLAAYGKTMMRAVGLSDDDANGSISSGKAVTAALA